MARSLRVLIVDDSDDDAMLLRGTLSRGGYEIFSEVVDKAADMRALLESQNWDIITSDHAMPQFSALGALSLAKEYCPEVPFIIVSGEIDINIAVSLMRSGAKDYIQKRELARLVPAIERALVEVELRIEQQQMKEDLQASESRYSRLFETTREGILILDTDTGKIIDVNPFLITMLGYTKGQFLGKQLWEIGAVADIEASKLASLELQSKGYVRYDNLPLQTVNGDQIAVEIISNEYLVDGKRIVQCNIRDITERKQAEISLRVSEELAHISTARLEKAQSIAHVGDWTWNIKDGQVEWSDEMYCIFGIDRKSFTGRLGDAITQVIHPDDLHIVLPSNASAFNDKRPIEYRIVRPDGSIHFIRAITGDTILDRDGVPIYLTGTCQDVTEHRQDEYSLKTSLEDYRLLITQMR